MGGQKIMKKALIIIDVQPAFVNNRNKFIIKNILDLIKKTKYDLYIESVFYAEKGSIWDKQTGWIQPKDENAHTVKEIRYALENKKTIHVEKTTKSVFKGNKDILKILKENRIKEIHIVGLQTNDCIIATAFEAFDLGFFTYVIEDCCEAETLEEHKIGMKILNIQGLVKK
jgi:nicotinamidase-related amidase